jgi:hypothetical protein
MVISLGDGSLRLRAVASPVRFDGYAPQYGLPPLLDEHRAEVLHEAAP